MTSLPNYENILAGAIRLGAIKKVKSPILKEHFVRCYGERPHCELQPNTGIAEMIFGLF